MPRGHEQDPIYSLTIYVLFGPIFLYVFLETDCNGKKKIIVPRLAVIIIAFFPKKCTVKFSFCPKSACKY